jgi:hypothetical protein
VPFDGEGAEHPAAGEERVVEFGDGDPVRRLLADEHEGEGVDREPESVGDLEVVGGAEVVAVVEDDFARLSAPGLALVDLRSTIAPGMRRSNRALCWIPLSSTQNADSS